jgi:protoheme IX farnesyltransferase
MATSDLSRSRLGKAQPALKGEHASPWLRLCALFASAATLLAVVSGAASLGAAHELLSALALPPLVAVAVAAWLGHRHLVVPSLVAIGLFGAAALLTTPGVHLAAAAAAFAATLVLTALAHRGERVSGSQRRRAQPGDAHERLGGSWRDYVTLTKPRIMTLLLLTGICGMFVGARGVPGLGALAAMTFGLALACGGASALNHVLDRDIDSLMGERTRARPVTSGRVPPSYALEFGLALSAFSFVLLAGVVNVLTATLALVGNLFYVLVYTRWLKRSTPQNIVIGGAAGAVPPLVGWAAATGNLTVPALLLFAIVFFWTPPHFWALALLIKRDYAAAGIPMLPVVRGERETVRQIVLYSFALVGVTVVPFLWGTLGLVYLVAALVLGGGFVWLAVGLARRTTPRRAALLFHSSLLYLALIFVFAAVDVVA